MKTGENKFMDISMLQTLSLSNILVFLHCLPQKKEPCQSMLHIPNVSTSKLLHLDVLYESEPLERHKKTKSLFFQ